MSVIVWSGGEPMKEILLLAGVFVFWVALQRYILPRFGVET